MVSDRPIRVFVLDDHELMREGIKATLETHDGMLVVGEAGTVRDALPLVARERPDVAVLDVKLPDGSGVDVCREIRTRFPDTQCLILTSFRSDEMLYEAIKAGAAGYILKRGMSGSTLVAAIRRVADGGSLLDPTLAGRVLDFIRGKAPQDAVAHLTDRERRMLALIGRGLTNRQIAETLHLGEQTVKNYVSRMLTKLGLERRSQAAALFAELTSREDGASYE